MGVNDRWIESLEKRIGDNEERIARLEAWRNYLLGAAFVIGMVVSLVGKKVLALLGV